MGAEKQNKAFLNLFKAILDENGYYSTIRDFASQRGITALNLAKQLLRLYERDAPDGMSVYWFLDTIEDTLNDPDYHATMQNCDTFDEVIEYIIAYCLWK